MLPARGAKSKWQCSRSCVRKPRAGRRRGQAWRERHMRRSDARRGSPGRWAWHVRRPWRSRLTCSSSSAPRGLDREHRSWSSSDARARAAAAASRCRRARRACRPARRAGRGEAAGRTRPSCGPTPGRTHRSRATRGSSAAVVQRRSASTMRRARPRSPPQDRAGSASTSTLRDTAGPDRLLDLLDAARRAPLPRREALGRRRTATSRLRSLVRCERTVEHELVERLDVRPAGLAETSAGARGSADAVRGAARRPGSSAPGGSSERPALAARAAPSRAPERSPTGCARPANAPQSVTGRRPRSPRSAAADRARRPSAATQRRSSSPSCRPPCRRRRDARHASRAGALAAAPPGAVARTSCARGTSGGLAPAGCVPRVGAGRSRSFGSCRPALVERAPGEQRTVRARRACRPARRRA